PTGVVTLAGSAASSNFPVLAGVQTGYAGNTDAFVSRFTAAGALMDSTYLGGAAGADQANGVAVDATGAIYAAGTTAANNFPTTTGAYQTAYGGGATDAFVAKLSATGDALLYSTFVGGSTADTGTAVAVDAQGRAYLTGDRVSGITGKKQLLVSRVSADGSALSYTTLVGGP